MPTLKLIDTITGETLEEFDAMDALLALRADGDMVLLIPNEEERTANGIEADDDLPEHIVMAGSVAAMLSDEEGVAVIRAWIDKNAHTHREH